MIWDARSLLTSSVPTHRPDGKQDHHRDRCRTLRVRRLVVGGRGVARWSSAIGVTLILTVRTGSESAADGDPEFTESQADRVDE